MKETPEEALGETGRSGSASRSLVWPLLAYFALTFFSFPHELPFGGLGSVTSIDLGMLCVWGVPAALALLVEHASPWLAARRAFFASLIAHSVFFHWFLVVTLEYGGMPLALGILAPLAPAIYVSLFTALFAYGWARFLRASPFAPLVGAAFWVVVDWARAHFLGGFPWATLGYALHLDLPLLGLTRWTGVYGLSFLIAAVGLATARLLSAGPRAEVETSEGRAMIPRAGSAPPRDRLRDLGRIGVSVLAAHLIGWMLTPGDLAETTTVRVAAIQGNIGQGEKWQADRRARIMESYLRLSAEAAAAAEAEGRPLDWIVWPETAVPGLIEHDPVLRAQLSRLARGLDVSLVVGGMGATVDARAQRYSAFFDSAFLIDPGGTVEDRYDKTHLVPFGEFVPLRGLLGQVFQSLATGLSSNDVTPGTRPRNLGLRLRGEEARILVGVPICYELLFPHLVRHFGGEQARVLLAVTNDAWYGRTGAPHQFLAMTTLRAAESGLPTVRAANTGISAIIDGRGRVTQKSPLFEEAFVVGSLALQKKANPTFYARFGDVFVLGCGLLVLLAGLGAKLESRLAVRRDAAG